MAVASGSQTARVALLGLVSWAASLAPAFAEGARGAEVVVIGTVHRPTANFSAEDLTRILERTKPDLILFEVDSSFVDKESQQLLERHRKMTLEAEAVTAFRAKSRVPLRPYDIEGRNQIYKDNNYFELQTKFSQAVLNLYQQNKLPPEARALFEALAALSEVRDAIAADRPEVINSPSSDAAIEKKQHYAHAGLKRVVELTPALAEFTGFREFTAAFWDRRNRAMASNILNQVKDFPGKRVVVLCGFEHRYYLRRLLKAEAAKAGVSVSEFWSFR